MTKDFYQWIFTYILNRNLKELIFLEIQLLACQNLRPLHLLGMDQLGGTAAWLLLVRRTARAISSKVIYRAQLKICSQCMYLLAGMEYKFLILLTCTLLVSTFLRESMFTGTQEEMQGEDVKCNLKHQK